MISGKEWKNRLAAIAIGVFLFCTIGVALEFGIRLAQTGSFRMPQSMFIEDTDLLYRLNPSNREYPNSFRGKAPSADSRGIRIFCVGGSTTFGYEVQWQEAWPEVVENYLGRKGLPVEVVNAGVPGYGSRQNLLRYNHDLSRYHPDVVVICEGWNRTGALVDSAEFVPAVRRDRDTWVKNIDILLVDNSLVIRKLHTLFTTVLESLREKSSVVDPVVHVQTWSMDPYPDVFQQDVTDLVRAIKDTKGMPVLVVYPALYHEGMTEEEIKTYEPYLYEHKKYQAEMLTELQMKHRAIRLIAERENVQLIDVQQEMGKFRGAERVRLFEDEMHLTVLGNKIVGEIVAEALLLRLSLSKN